MLSLNLLAKNRFMAIKNSGLKALYYSLFVFRESSASVSLTLIMPT
ncbi:hypothetical protein EBME_1221 [bacterium endosymbiont of Mortierella elongata FMR23-6]|nr:hypothetical protein EBME_1221 [bacterium endosymbiont of Mortierella elongata FMR23-6]